MRFDKLNRTIEMGNWQYTLKVEEQKLNGSTFGNGIHYLKATLYLGNKKTDKSLLYSLSKDSKSYEEKYQYLSFDSKDDLYIRSGSDYLYPIGYVFEPSNGLSKNEKLVYKFKISNEMFNKLEKNNLSVEYWYVDKLAGLGKICFKQQ